jgi:hypothetical protein
LKPVYFKNETFEAFEIDHFIDFTVGNLYLYWSAVFSFFIIVEISKSFDDALLMNFGKQFVCFRINYSWNYQQ